MQRALFETTRELLDNALDAGATRVSIAIASDDGADESFVDVGVEDDGCGMADPRECVRVAEARRRAEGGGGGARSGGGLAAVVVHAQREQCGERYLAPVHVATAAAGAHAVLRVGINPRDGSVVTVADDGSALPRLAGVSGTRVAVRLVGRLDGTAPRLAAHVERLVALPGSAEISFTVGASLAAAADGAAHRARPGKRARGAAARGGVGPGRALDAAARDAEAVTVCAPSSSLVFELLRSAGNGGGDSGRAAVGVAHDSHDVRRDGDSDDDDARIALYVASYFGLPPEFVAATRTTVAGAPQGSDDEGGVGDGSAVAADRSHLVVRVFAALRDGTTADDDPSSDVSPHGGASAGLGGSAPCASDAGGGALAPPRTDVAVVGAPSGSRPRRPAAPLRRDAAHGIVHVVRYAAGRPLLGDAAACAITAGVAAAPWRDVGLQVQPWAASALALTATGARSKRGDTVLAGAPALPTRAELGAWAASDVDAAELPLLARSAVADAPDVPFHVLTLLVDVDVDVGSGANGVMDSGRGSVDARSGRRDAVAARRLAGLARTHVGSIHVSRDAIAAAVAAATHGALLRLQAQLPGRLRAPAAVHHRMLADVYLPSIAEQLARMCALAPPDSGFRARALAAVGVAASGDVEAALVARLRDLAESTLTIAAAAEAATAAGATAAAAAASASAQPMSRSGGRRAGGMAALAKADDLPPCDADGSDSAGAAVAAGATDDGDAEFLAAAAAAGAAHALQQLDTALAVGRRDRRALRAAAVAGSASGGGTAASWAGGGGGGASAAGGAAAGRGRRGTGSSSVPSAVAASSDEYHVATVTAAQDVPRPAERRPPASMPGPAAAGSRGGARDAGGSTGMRAPVRDAVGGGDGDDDSMWWLGV